uniref:Protein UXT n=5 Tax=Triticinae TaxID=1648030 RepID=A0A453L373_AEGTS
PAAHLNLRLARKDLRTPPLPADSPSSLVPAGGRPPAARLLLQGCRLQPLPAASLPQPGAHRPSSDPLLLALPQPRAVVPADRSKDMAMAVEARLRQEKVKKFEDFVDRRLKPDLVNAIAQRDNLFQQQKTFLDLKKNIENLEKNGVTSMRSMVNLGSEVYMQAEVPDTKHIFVDIGLGFHVEFTWQEALQFISVREARLARQIDEYTHLIASIKAQIKLVCEGIRELLQFPAE